MNPALREILTELPGEKKDELLERLLRLQESSALASSLDPEQAAVLLQKRFESLRKTTRFKAGELVCWKPGLKNRLLPEEGHPAIVLEVLKDAILQEQFGPETPHYREPLDIVLGILTPEGHFLQFHFDSRRLQRYTPGDASDEKGEA